MAKRMFLTPKAPADIAANFRDIDATDADALGDLLEQRYFADCPEGYLSTDAGRDDLADHLTDRLQFARNCVIPWLTSFGPLAGTRVLEVGCGTGSSSVALAEQGACVTSVDVDDKSLDVARTRCRSYGVQVAFIRANAADAEELFGHGREQYDMVIHWAALEHMTHDERLAAMRGTWRILPREGLWCVVDSPNRLWYFDSHSSLLPFFDWLSDDLAIEYCRFSPRQIVRRIGEGNPENARDKLIRVGRGISFHEFDLAIAPTGQLNVVGSMSQFYRSRSVMHRLKWRLSGQRRYERFLAKLCPGIHGGFFEQYLNLAIRKTT